MWADDFEIARMLGVHPWELDDVPIEWIARAEVVLSAKKGAAWELWSGEQVFATKTILLEF